MDSSVVVRMVFEVAVDKMDNFRTEAVVGDIAVFVAQIVVSVVQIEAVVEQIVAFVGQTEAAAEHIVAEVGTDLLGFPIDICWWVCHLR